MSADIMIVRSTSAIVTIKCCKSSDLRQSNCVDNMCTVITAVNRRGLDFGCKVGDKSELMLFKVTQGHTGSSDVR